LAEDRQRPGGQPTRSDRLARWWAVRLLRMIGGIGIRSNDRFNEGTKNANRMCAALGRP